MSQTYSFQYEFTEDIAKIAVNAFIQKPKLPPNPKATQGFYLLLFMTLACGAPLMLSDWSDLPWITLLPLFIVGGLLATIVLLHLFAWTVTQSYPLLRWYALRKMTKPFRDLGDRTIRWLFSEHGFEVRTMNKDRAVSWDQVQKLVTYPGFWMVCLKGGPNLMLPEQYLSSDIQDLIWRKATEVGAKVSGRVQRNVNSEV